MFSITPLSLISFEINVGFAVTGIGNLAGGRCHSAEDVKPLRIHWHDLTDDPSPFALMSWKTKLSTFSGRQEELENLKKWISSESAISVKFLTGEGGAGKSRLGAYFAEMLNEQKWTAGFINLRNPLSFPLAQNGTLLLVDYPEENHQPVNELLNDLAKLPPDHKIRVLFLTRRSIYDWMDKIGDSNAIDLMDMAPIHLTGVE
ncbi:MAG: hypothetical protein GF315_00815, partial [candidate division Zixibacteria bacterium]|nr:hypothetical protein [candidate division Zixibacteria bacterium]